ncbi:MAG: viral A-type inclusion protein [Enterococcus sp.]
MSEETTTSTPESEVSRNTSQFNEIKEVASKNIGQMLQDLQAFEVAIAEDNIPDIYRIYNGRLHEELKRTSNTNHEIDQLLAQKIHDGFMETFPFMVHHAKISETMNYYRVGNYYRERPVIGIDSSAPEIFIIPKIDEEWAKFKSGKQDVLASIERQMDELSAKVITAQGEITKFDEQIKKIRQEEKNVTDAKGFFNRSKTDEELEALEKQVEELEAKKAAWIPYAEDRSKVGKEKEKLELERQKIRLEKAVVEKEFRLIERYFGGLEGMQEQIISFLASYLKPKGEASDDQSAKK